MLHKEFWGLLFLAFVGWIILASSPSQRIENGCRPVHWAGNVVTSASALVLPKQQVTVQKWFDKVEYGCQYTVWRLFYQDDYNKWVLETEAAQAAAVEKALADAEKKKSANEPEPPASKPAAPAEPEKSAPVPAPAVDGYGAKE